MPCQTLTCPVAHGILSPPAQRKEPAIFTRDLETMANLLIIDANGRRRAAFEVAAHAAGHHVFNAGTIAEALNAVTVYVPEAIVVAGALPDGAATDVVAALRASERPLVRQTIVITDGPNTEDPQFRRAASSAPRDLLAAATSALDRTAALP